MDTAGAAFKKRLVNVYHYAATATELNTGKINYLKGIPTAY